VIMGEVDTVPVPVRSTSENTVRSSAVVRTRILPSDSGNTRNGAPGMVNPRSKSRFAVHVCICVSVPLGRMLIQRLSRDADKSVRSPLPMNRFRPNLVVSGSTAFAEDAWDKVRIGEAVFRSTKPCERCVMTTVDQSIGEFTGKEPLKTLASYRMAKDVMPDRYESLGVGANAVLFGQNLIYESAGATVHVGDAVEVMV